MSLLARYEWFKYSLVVTDFSGSLQFLKAAEELQTTHSSNKRFEILSVVKLKIKKKQLNKAELKYRLKHLVSETRVFLLHCNM